MATLAINGGEPVRTDGFPAWPTLDAAATWLLCEPPLCCVSIDLCGLWLLQAADWTVVCTSEGTFEMMVLCIVVLLIWSFDVVKTPLV